MKHRRLLVALLVGALTYSTAPLHAQSQARRNPAASLVEHINTVLDTDVPEYRANGQDVRETVEGIGRSQGFPILIDPDVTGKVTFTVFNAKLRTILDAICIPQGWSWEVSEAGFLHIQRFTVRTYKIDYLQLTQTGSSSATVSLSGSGGSGGSDSGSGSGSGSSSGGSSGGSSGSGSGSGGGGGGDSGSSSLSVSQTNDTDFWARFQDDIKAMLSADEIATINKFGGIMQVSASAKTHARIEDYVRQLMERVRRQVFISVQIMRVELNNQFQLGIDWNLAAFQFGSDKPSNGVTIGRSFTAADGSVIPGTFTNTAVTAVGATTLSPAAFTGTIAADKVSALVRALKEQGNVSTETKPEIATLNNLTAFVQLSEDVPFFRRTSETSFNQGGSSTNGNQPITERNYEERVVSFGNLLEVTPQISDEDEVQLSITPSVTDLRGIVTSPDGQATAPRQGVNRLRSIVTLRNGETYVMGGFLSSTKGKNNRRVPLLGDIPGIGKAFQSEATIDNKTEMAVLITVRIRKPQISRPQEVRVPVAGVVAAPEASAAAPVAEPASIPAVAVQPAPVEATPPPAPKVGPVAGFSASDLSL